MLHKSLNNLINDNFHALTHKNFRSFWLGQCISLIGTWMQTMGQSWLVLTLTNSPLLLGLLGAVQFLPITFFTLFAGVIVDKYPKKLILLITHTMSMMLALILAFLVFSHSIKYEYILIIGGMLGLANAFDMPSRQAFTVEIAGRDDLMNAVALNSAIFNLAKILGPSIGAVVMAYLGAGWCFLLNGLSFIAVIFGLSQIKVNSYIRERNSNSILNEIKDGLKYVYKEKILFRTILLVSIIGIFAFNYNILVPVLTKSVLHRQEAGYGVLMALLGIGSLIGALTVSTRNRSGPRTKVMVYSTAIISITLFLIGFITNFYLVAVMLCIAGVFNIYFATTANSTLQLNSKDEYRSRVMSVYSLVFAGSTPVGNLLVGFSSSSIGVSKTFSLSGMLISGFTILILLILK